MEFVFNVCRACMVPNFHNNHLSIFDNNGKYAKELFFVAGLSVSYIKFNYVIIEITFL